MQHVVATEACNDCAIVPDVELANANDTPLKWVNKWVNKQELNQNIAMMLQ